MGENKFYFWGIVIGSILAIALLVYLLFFNETKVPNLNSGANFSGGSGSSNYRAGNTVNFSTTINKGGSGKDGGLTTISYNYNGKVEQIKQQKVSNASLSSSSFFVTLNENQTNLLINKQGETLAFAATSPQKTLEMDALDIPGYSSRGYTPSNKMKSGVKEKVCLVIFAEITKDRVKIMSLSEADRYAFVLDKLRYIEIFGGMEYEKQKRIVESVLRDIAAGRPLNAKAYCDDILNPLDLVNNIYGICLIVVEGIIVNNITNPVEIKQKLSTIPAFSVISEEDVEMLVQIIIKGLKEGNLSKERICSLITSLIIKGIEGTALYQQCLVVMGLLSQMPSPSYSTIEKSLSDGINGFKSLSPATKKLIIQGIIDDPRIGGTLNVQYHCSFIVSSIIAMLENSSAYQTCINLLQALLPNRITTAAEIRKAMLYGLGSVPGVTGFIILEEKEQIKVSIAIEFAIQNGTLIEESKEICRNLAALILDASTGNETFQQCYRILEMFIKSPDFKGLQTSSTVIEAKLKGIPLFKALKEEDRNFIIQKVKEVKVEEDLHPQITDICLILTSMILDYITNSVTFEQCMKAMNELLEERDSILALSTTNALQAIEVKLITITGYSMRTAKEKAEYKQKVFIALKDDTLEDDRVKICRALAALILNGFDNNEVYKLCVSTIEGILPSKNIKTIEDIKEVFKITPFFNSFSPQIQTQYAEKILAIRPPNVPEQISAICEQMAIDAENAANLLQCVKVISSTVIAKKQGIRDYVISQMNTVNAFKTLENDILRDSIIDQIRALKNITLLPNGTLNEDEYKKTLEDAVKICNQLINKKPDPSIVTPVKPDKIDKDKDNILTSPTKPVTGVTNNINPTNPEQTIITQPNQNYGKCAILNRLVAETYNDYANEVNIFNLPVVADNKIEALNNKLPEDEYYIPDFYIQKIEEGLINDYENILNDNSSIASALYSKFEQSSTATKKLHPRAKSTLISRLYRDKGDLIKIRTEEEMITDYIVEIGKCTDPKKDIEFWKKASFDMKNAMRGVQESLQNFSQNLGGKSVIETSENYTKCKVIAKSGIKDAEAINKELLTKIQNFRNISDGFKDKFVTDIGTISLSCRDGCDEKIHNLCLSLANQTLVYKAENRASPKLSEISKCYTGYNSVSQSTLYTEFALLSATTQRALADNAWRVMIAFNKSAKEKRKIIIKAIWNATEVNFNAGKKEPVPPAVCEQAANDVWADYDEDSLQNALQGPFDALIQSLQGLIADYESGEALSDFTAPPSDRCKCHIEKIHAKLHNASIANFQSCRSADDASKNLAFVKANVSKYLNSKEASIAAQTDVVSGEQGKTLCVTMFKAVQDMIDDIGEVNKFTQNATSNEVTLNQICVQQLRGVYSTVGTFKEEYFKAGEIETYRAASSCDGFKD